MNERTQQTLDNTGSAPAPPQMGSSFQVPKSLKRKSVVPHGMTACLVLQTYKLKFPVNAVEFDRVSKNYAIYARPLDRLRELLLRGRSYHRDFHAVRDLSFEIRRGEVFCIVGENGSGKSTTLEIIAGIMQPATGSVTVTGRGSAL